MREVDAFKVEHILIWTEALTTTSVFIMVNLARLADEFDFRMILQKSPYLAYVEEKVLFPPLFLLAMIKTNSF